MAENVSQEIQKIEEAIRKRVCIGSQVATSKLMEELQEKYNSGNVMFALNNLVRNG